MIKKDFDVFIAYHGSYDKNGTKSICDRLYDYLKQNGIRPFYFPRSDKDTYKANIIEVLRSKTFILVSNENIHVTQNNEIDVAHHYELATEIDAFYALTQAGTDVHVLDSKVLVCGDYMDKRKKGQEAELHGLFANRTHFFMNNEDEEQSFAEVLKWIKERLNLRKDSNVWQTSQTSTEVKQIFVKRSSMSQQIDLPNILAHSKNIRAMGISNSELTSKMDPEALQFAIDRGATVEMLFLDPDSLYTAAREKEEGLRDGRIRNITLNNIDTAIDFKLRLPENQRDNYKMYKYSKVPRMNVILLDSYAILQYYANSEAGMRNPCFLIEKQEVSPLYDFCEESYLKIKNVSTEIEV
ncbi:MAG: hypothetical protein K2N22_03505 [Clostridia bacterium]|nr:hypothetical protein [Clostridia bacterium]